MKIGIDLTFIRPDHKNGGTEAVIKNLITAMNDVCSREEAYSEIEFVYIIHRDIYNDYKSIFPNLSYYVYDFKFSHPVRMVLFQTFYLPKLVKKLNLDLLYFPTFQTGLSRNYKIPLVVNPHDIQFCYYPQYFSRLKRLYLKTFYTNSLKKASDIVVISNYVKNCYEENFSKVIGNKIKLIYNPIDFSNESISEEEFIEFCKNTGIDQNKDYILCINSLTKHKNIITLIKAFSKICGDKNLQLVLGGAKWNDANELSQYIESHHLESQVILTGFLSDKVLKALYKHAKVFVTPSLYEGFGMTPIEAVNALCPVISSKETSLYEVTKGLVHYYEPAVDENALANEILNVLDKIDCGKITKESLEGIRTQMIETYNFDHIAKEYLNLFLKHR